MILTLEDDGCIHVYTIVEDVVLNVEPLDAEECLKAVFDHTGQRYVVERLTPHTDGRFGIGNGQYRLVPVNQPDLSGLQAMLASTPQVLPESAQAFVATLKRELSSRA